MFSLLSFPFLSLFILLLEFRTFHNGTKVLLKIIIESNAIKIKRHAWSLMKWNCEKFFFVSFIFLRNGCDWADVRLQKWNYILLGIISYSIWMVKYYYCSSNLSIRCLCPNSVYIFRCVLQYFFLPKKEHQDGSTMDTRQYNFFCKLNSLNSLQSAIMYIRAGMHACTSTHTQHTNKIYDDEMSIIWKLKLKETTTKNEMATPAKAKRNQHIEIGGYHRHLTQRTIVEWLF